MTAAETELGVRSFLTTETPAVAGILTTLVFVAFGDALLSDLENHLLTIAIRVPVRGDDVGCVRRGAPR